MGDPAKTIGLISTLNIEILIAMTILKIIAEILLGILSLWAGLACWGAVRKGKYLREKLADERFLNEWLGLENTKQALSQLASRIEPSVDFAINIEIEVRSDKYADKKLIQYGAVGMLVILISGFFIDYWFIAINTFLFSIAWPLSFNRYNSEAAKSALTTIAQLGAILYKWNKQDSVGCKEFMREAKPLQKLYNAVTRIQ